MAVHIEGADLSEAWVRATDHLVQHGDDVNVMVQVIDPSPSAENLRVRRVLDRYLKNHRYDHSVQTVANTIFPSELYRPNAQNPREHLYNNAEDAWRIHRRRKKPETYFRRLTAYEVGTATPVNQLEQIITTLRGKTVDRRTPHHRNNELEAVLTTPHQTSSAAFYRAGDRIVPGFPCLIHLSFTLHRDRLTLTALYRSQNYIQRAYGNYLGLARLLAFVSTETEALTGELVIVASAASPELDGRGNRQRKSDVQTLLKDARAALVRVS